MDRIDLVIIDPQFDFCDPSGSLYVAGAEKDMERGAGLIQRLGKRISNIHVTLDSHHLFDIAHPIFWKDSSGKNPDPFTIISHSDVKDGAWIPVYPSLMKHCLEYTKTLEDGGRYPLCIWPPHCLIGSKGATVYSDMYSALTDWEKDNVEMVDYITKGSNYTTEHYSAIKAEVPDQADPSTAVNTAFIQTLMEADIIPVMGEASSHCVLNTLQDIITEFSDDSWIKKLVIIEDATSPVDLPEYRQKANDFFQELKNKGVQFSTTDKFLI
jgi:nicotinamidase-related amidase